MRLGKAAIVVLLLGVFALVFPPWISSQSGDIVVTGADSLLKVPSAHSTELTSTASSTSPRVAVEYAHSTLRHVLTVLPSSLQDRVDAVSDRVAAEYAHSTARWVLTEAPAELQTALVAVSNRVAIEYACSTHRQSLVYPIELIGDTTPPQITDIAVTPVGSSSVNVTWTTDEFATSAVDYGTEPGNHPNTISDAYYTKQHAVVMSSLLPNTTYYFLVSSADQSGNVAASVEQSFSTALHIAKSVLPEGEVDYSDELTYSLVIWAMLETHAGLYDPLDGVSFVHFVQRPGGVTYDDGTITGTLTVPSGDQVVVSFVARVDVPGTEGDTAPVTNDACVYPSGGTIEEDCVWSNEVTNIAFRPYEIYLPVTLRSY